MKNIKLSRNEQCLCGKNLKYKNCCQKEGINFVEVSEKELKNAKEFDKKLDMSRKSDSYFEYIKLVDELRTECLTYKKQAFKENIGSKNLFYLFKILKDGSIYLFNISNKPFYHKEDCNMDIISTLKKLLI